MFVDARDALRRVLEDEIENETRAVCPAATGVAVEIYIDELGEPRGRLIAVTTAAGSTEDQNEHLVELLAGPLDEWATTAHVASTDIRFHLQPEHR
ncbi:hypothetical protein [Frankia sp. R82]|uniref:hypothetical protein n=1 Tax=Frankia sp. R82 TaxID=2950553 RepID=UPI0020444B4F|nr:hypothetical protein [Frankia sp. R82]MCM3883149.1 hypothetical protein [Frankia sp. R82]